MKVALIVMLIPWLFVGILIGRALRALAKAKPRVMIVSKEKLDAQEDE